MISDKNENNGISSIAQCERCEGVLGLPYIRDLEYSVCFCSDKCQYEWYLENVHEEGTTVYRKVKNQLEEF